MKPGIKSTEFLTTAIIQIIALIALALILMGIFPNADDRAVPILAALAGLAQGTYTIGRSMVKMKNAEFESSEDSNNPPVT